MTTMVGTIPGSRAIGDGVRGAITAGTALGTPAIMAGMILGTIPGTMVTTAGAMAGAIPTTMVTMAGTILGTMATTAGVDATIAAISAMPTLMG